jgi:hypothetical protein
MQQEEPQFWRWYRESWIDEVKRRWWINLLGYGAAFFFLRRAWQQVPHSNLLPLIRNPFFIASWVSLYFYNQVLDFMEFKMEKATGLPFPVRNPFKRQSAIPNAYKALYGEDSVTRYWGYRFNYIVLGFIAFVFWLLTSK